MNNISDYELAELCSSNNLSLDALQERINLLGPRVSSQNPSCLHEACGNKKVTLEIVQLLYNTFPGALRLRADDDSLPIHNLCDNYDLDDTASINILQFMLNIDPTLPREMDDGGYLPIHVAVTYKSTVLCKILIDAYPESLRIESGEWLPIHIACRYGERDDAADTIQYMLELDPELINTEDNNSYLPIHCAATYGRTESIQLLLKFDPDAASKEVDDGSRLLPLHIASYKSNLSSIQTLYDAYPEAILARSSGGRLPVDIEQSHGNQPAIEFLQTQLVYARQAQDITAMTTVDENGQLPLHRVLKDNAPLGSIKLLVRGNRVALQVAADQNGVYPIHIACEFSSTMVVKYLVDLAGDTLDRCDANNNSLLHYACRGGNIYLLCQGSPCLFQYQSILNFIFEKKYSGESCACTQLESTMRNDWF